MRFVFTKLHYNSAFLRDSAQKKKERKKERTNVRARRISVTCSNETLRATRRKETRLRQSAGIRRNLHIRKASAAKNRRELFRVVNERSSRRVSTMKINTSGRTPRGHGRRADKLPFAKEGGWKYILFFARTRSPR